MREEEARAKKLACGGGAKMSIKCTSGKEEEAPANSNKKKMKKIKKRQV